jgi:hypothetical protein
MADRLIIVGCGAGKLDIPAPASVLYTGPYFRACYKAAGRLATGLVLILPAKYGLLRPDQVISPYDVTLGRAGAVNAAKLRAQARRLGLLDCPVTVLAARRYAGLVLRVWPDAETPLAGLGGIGKQLHELKALYEA